MAEIVLRDVQKYFGAVHIIKDLNLTIADREFVVLLGPSGCGKTTTLRAIAGLEEISSGEILIDGRPVHDLEASNRDIAFVFQLYALYPHLTVFENIAFPLRATGEKRSEVEKQVREVARALDIVHLLKKRPSALSGGDMQRVAIGRALVRRPKAILMDEPIGALDAKLREDMRTELKRLHIENKATSVYVTHDQVEAMSLADRIVVMNEGILQQVGTPTDVYQNPANLFVAQFIGSPVMNIAKATLATEGERSALVLGENGDAFPMPAELKGRLTARGGPFGDLKIGIRPEGVLVAHEAGEGFVPLEAHLIEPLGAYDIVDLKVGGSFLRARTRSGFVSGPGERVFARLDETQTHFFDTKSGQSLQIRLGA
ncbi:ABC transporter ATP-binding protein [Kaistia dalseonensis]|uniref:Multiple sugar transport system ATP-binding protein n=1 Tax=Kaistia dalseonensis TaxID=410840 RepID=A0ABU0H8I2_9HYPH|nr:ABC transporter ATP-binding protein [Kaistia dalseonensis]MCX5496015.1 ABC transporter ATP-binding protein [Kaistia dalseonensis]MDQ0438618.1 multiple sugar transport system ATP-binding protein [Kaistia dalseonensis]